jgi:hypothetical protein
MADDNAPWWVLVAGSAIPSIAVGAWTFIQWWGSREERRRDRELGVQDKREAGITREREQLAATSTGIISNLRTDLDRCREQLDQASVDRYRGWDVARFWYDFAWRMRHQAIHARQLAESAVRLRGEDPPVWPESLDIPAFDEHGKGD